MFIGVEYKSNGEIVGLYKESFAHKYRNKLPVRPGVSRGVVMKADGPLGDLQGYEIRKQFRVKDVPKEGFVVLERAKNG